MGRCIIGIALSSQAERRRQTQFLGDRVFEYALPLIDKIRPMQISDILKLAEWFCRCAVELRLLAIPPRPTLDASSW